MKIKLAVLNNDLIIVSRKYFKSWKEIRRLGTIRSSYDSFSDNKRSMCTPEEKEKFKDQPEGKWNEWYFDDLSFCEVNGRSYIKALNGLGDTLFDINTCIQINTCNDKLDSEDKQDLKNET